MALLSAKNRQEKLVKLEGSMRDNRQILSDAGAGAEVVAVVQNQITPHWNNETLPEMQ